ncbi:methyl-accepting chemotaxis protein [Zoogloea sp.]|uniref:methyl-accepting chemotaxis protein n=1 Tax=Zoogloea sp. TaxID=49181 RepID=UPI0035B1EABB
MSVFGKWFGGSAATDGDEVAISALELANLKGQLAAIDKTQAVIEFDLDGNILTANQNFLKAVGYELGEIVGRHHSIFMPPADVGGEAYRDFWRKLAGGTPQAGQFKRLGKHGREVWLQAAYNPIIDTAGTPFKVVKYATDITTDKQRTADFEGQMAAIGKSQAIIEFGLDGKVLTANDNFLKVLGYSLAEVVGRHHSIFIAPADVASADYQVFWDKLGRGEYDTGRYRRIARDGREVWIQASYNPILDLNGRPCKIVKYAADITRQVEEEEALRQTVEETLSVVSAAVAGDLTRQISLAGKSGMLESLSEGVNSLLDSMVQIVRQIKASSNEVLLGAQEIAKGNADLSARTEEQASSLEETASSMEQLNATVRQNADNARQANALATRSHEDVMRGSTVVRQVVATMNEIQERSSKISDIIGVIDSIAFQTNILALNAAVEAARAGEQGRGFAVVATEVRNLAQRSAQAAQEIKALIGSSVRTIEAGASQVNEAGTTMETLVASFQEVSSLVSEISGASREQSQGIEQITTAVGQMDEVTQQNAALVEEAAAAAESLEEQASALVRVVSRFRVDGGTPVGVVRPHLVAGTAR